VRAYSPRLATVHLANDIAHLPGIAKVDIVSSHRGTHPKPAQIKVTLDSRDGWGKPISTVFSLPEAREWFASEKAR